MRVTFICMRAERRNQWHPGHLVHSARLVPVVDGAPEAREYFVEPPSGAIELDGLAAEHFTVGRTYVVHFEEITPEGARASRRNGTPAGRE
jgi:hypothetical protein